MKSWRSRWLCVAVLVAGVAILHKEVLFAGQVYHGEDAADGYYPSHVAILRALAHGELPTWERGSWSGWPLAADPYYGLFYPLSALYAVFGAVRGLAVTVAVHALLAGLGMLWLLRRRKLDWGPALFGAVSLAFGSFMVERIRHVIFAQMMAWLPLVLAGVEGYLAERRARDLVLAAAATGMLLVCGALPLAPFVIFVAAAYVLPRVGELPRAERPGVLAWLGAAAATGGLIAAAQIVLTVAHLPSSPRSLGVDYELASSYAWPDLRYLGVLLMPDLFGGPERGHYFGAFNHWEMAGWYAGALTVLVAPLGLLSRRRERWALAGVALLGILLAFGDHGPLHKLFFRFVPLYGALRCPARALVMDLVVLPILAADGLAWLAAAATKAKTGTGTKTKTLLAAAAFAVVAFATGGYLLSLKGGAAPYVAGRQAVAHLLLVLGAGAPLALLLGRGLVGARTGTFALALVSLVDLVTVSRGYVQPRPSDWASGTERFAAVDWLIAQHPSDRFVTEWRGPFRLHNLGMTYALEGAGGYDSFTIWRYVNFLYVLNHGEPYPWKKLKHDLAAGDVQRPGSPLADLLDVRWYIGTSAPAPHFIERYRPRPGELHAVHEPNWDPQLNVYENTHALPRAFVVHHATVLPDDDAQARALVTLDPRHDVILDAAPAVSPLPAADAAAETAKIVALERHRVVLEAELTAPGILVLSDAAYPGWRVTVDGKEAPLLRADYALRGVALPAGHHRVEHSFHSRPATLGLSLSGLGLLLLAALAIASRRGAGSRRDP